MSCRHFLCHAVYIACIPKAHLCVYATPHMLIGVPCSIFIASVLHALATPVEDSAASCNCSRRLCQHDQAHNPRCLAVSAAVLDTQAATLDGAGVLIGRTAYSWQHGPHTACPQPAQPASDPCSCPCHVTDTRYHVLHCIAVLLIIANKTQI